MVMEKIDFLIPVNGLASGKTSYRWTVGREFFEEFENPDIIDASVEVEAVAEKSGHYIGVDCHISGSVTVSCDRCLGRLAIPVDTTGRLSVKFGSVDDGTETSAEEDGREIVLLSGSDADLDMRQIIYDYTCLSLPMQRVHAEGECDPEVTRYLGGSRQAGEAGGEETPFSVLKDMFRN